MNEKVDGYSVRNADRLVHIVDPDAERCEALSVLFRLEGFQTDFSLSIEGFFSSEQTHRADVIVLNLGVDGQAGLSMLRRIRSARHDLPVFILLDEQDLLAAVNAMKAGATDIVTRPIDTARLVRAVHETLRPDSHPGVANDHRQPVEVRRFSRLTPRERDVLQLITSGRSNKEAGRALGISPRTVEVHRARVMEKLGARNTADLTRIALTS